MKLGTQTLLTSFLLIGCVGFLGCQKPDTDSATGENASKQGTLSADGAISASSDHHYFHKTEKPHAAIWTYDGATGPSHWGDLSTKYVLAKDGKQQSPINIALATSEALPTLDISYRPSKIDLVYNGHTIEETEEAGSSLTVNGHEFGLKQFHFHAPSEHTIDGKHAAMEMHLVHIDKAGRIAVIGVMILEGEQNDAFDPVWKYLPTEENKKLENAVTIDASALLPSDRSYYHYMGSLTTPPCTQDVNWYVLTTPVELSKEQIAKFTGIIDHNNRPVQPLNGRTVAKSTP